MRNTILRAASTAGALLLTAGAVAQPTIGATPLGTIAVNGIETVPTGIDNDGTTLYVAGFSNRRIVKIPSAVYETPGTPEQFAATDSTDGGPVTWGGGRGLQNLRVDSNGNVLASGDQGTNGAILLYDSAGTLLDGVYGANQIGGADRRITGADFYGSGYVFAETVSLVVGTVASDLSTLGTTNSTGVSFNRSVKAIGDDVYVSIADAAANETIAKLSGGTAGALNDKTVNATWYDHAFAIASAVRWNLSHYNYNGTDYLIATDASNQQVLFINLGTGLADLTLTNASHGIQSVGGSCVVETTQGDFLCLTMNDTGGSANGRVVIYSIDGSELIDPSSVDNWMMY